MKSKPHKKRQKSVLFVSKSLEINMITTKIIVKLKIIVITQVNREMLNIAYVI